MAAPAIHLRQLSTPVLDTMARAALSPVLITQALRVRRTAQSLPEASGPRDGVTGSGPPLRLAVIGDSSAAGVGVTSQDDALMGRLVAHLSPRFTVTWHLDALTGATTKSTLSRLQDATAEPIDVIITGLGVNDVTRLIPAKTWVRQQNALFKHLHTLYAPRQIYVSGMAPLGAFPLLPQPLRWTLGRHARKLETARIRSLVTQTAITHVPFDLSLEPQMMASDGFHPGPELYDLWAKEMASRIISDWPYFSSTDKS